MIVAFWQLPARPYKPQERPPPERVSLAEEALSSDPMQAWFESRDVFACSRKVAQKRKGRQWPIFKTPFGADSHSSGVQVREAAARTLEETSVASARRVHALDSKPTSPLWTPSRGRRQKHAGQRGPQGWSTIPPRRR